MAGRLLELLLWVDGGTPSVQLVRYLHRLASDEAVRSARCVETSTNEIQRRDAAEALIELLPVCDASTRMVLVDILCGMAEASTANAACLGHHNGGLFDAALTVLEREQRHRRRRGSVDHTTDDAYKLLSLLATVGGHTLCDRHVRRLQALIFFTPHTEALLQALMLVKRILGHASAAAGAVPKSFFSFNGPSSGFALPADSWPAQGFTLCVRLYPRQRSLDTAASALDSAPRLWSYVTDGVVWGECVETSRGLRMDARRGEKVHSVSMDVPLPDGCWTDLAITFQHKRFATSVVTVYVSGAQVAQRDIKYPSPPSGRGVLHLFRDGGGSRWWRGLCGSVLALRDACPPEHVRTLRDPGSLPENLQKTVWFSYTADCVSRLSVLDSPLKASDTRVLNDAVRGSGTGAHTLMSPVESLRRGGGTPLFVLLLKRFGEVPVRGSGDLTGLRDCVVACAEVISALVAGSTRAADDVQRWNGFGLVALALRALPSPLLSLPLVRSFTGLLHSIPDRGAQAQVLRHLLIGPEGLAVWRRAAFEVQHHMLCEVVSFVRKGCRAAAGAQAFAAWFRGDVATVATVLDLLSNQFSADGAADDFVALSAGQRDDVRRLLTNLCRDLIEVSTGFEYADSIALLNILRTSHAGPSPERYHEEVLELFTGLLLRDSAAEGSPVHEALAQCGGAGRALRQYWVHPTTAVRCLALKAFGAELCRAPAERRHRLHRDYGGCVAFMPALVATYSTTTVQSALEVVATLKELLTGAGSRRNASEPSAVPWGPTVEEASALEPILAFVSSAGCPPKAKAAALVDLATGVRQVPALRKEFLGRLHHGLWQTYLISTVSGSYECSAEQPPSPSAGGEECFGGDSDGDEVATCCVQLSAALIGAELESSGGYRYVDDLCILVGGAGEPAATAAVAAAAAVVAGCSESDAVHPQPPAPPRHVLSDALSARLPHPRRFLASLLALLFGSLRSALRGLEVITAGRDPSPRAASLSSNFAGLAGLCHELAFGELAGNADDCEDTEAAVSACLDAFADLTACGVPLLAPRVPSPHVHAGPPSLSGVRPAPRAAQEQRPAGVGPLDKLLHLGGWLLRRRCSGGAHTPSGGARHRSEELEQLRRLLRERGSAGLADVSSYVDEKIAELHGQFSSQMGGVAGAARNVLRLAAAVPAGDAQPAAIGYVVQCLRRALADTDEVGDAEGWLRGGATDPGTMSGIIAAACRKIAADHGAVLYAQTVAVARTADAPLQPVTVSCDVAFTSLFPGCAHDASVFIAAVEQLAGRFEGREWEQGRAEHCRQRTAELARECSRHWQQLAEMERRSEQDSRAAPDVESPVAVGVGERLRDATLQLQADWQRMERGVHDTLVLHWWTNDRTARGVPRLSFPHGRAADPKKSDRMYWRLDVCEAGAGRTRHRMKRWHPPEGQHGAVGGRRVKSDSVMQPCVNDSLTTTSMHSSFASLHCKFEPQPQAAAGGSDEESGSDGDDDGDDEEEDALQPSVRLGADAAVGANKRTTAQARSAQAVERASCELVTPLELVPGVLTLTQELLLFTLSHARSDGADDGFTLRSRDLVVRVDDITAIHNRRYFLQPTSLEVFAEGPSRGAKAYMFKFVSQSHKSRVLRALRGLKPSRVSLMPSASRTPAQVARRLKVTERWVKRQLSNYDYLIELNTIAGRTFNDINQYPVFPWILADYGSDSIDLSDPAVYRDLSLPVGALNPARLRGFVSRYEDSDGSGVPRFHYGSHYSYGGAVLYYLCRVEPYASLLLKLQGGTWDHADRMFHSVAESWQGVLQGPQDVKELVPELFSLPEVLLNRGGFDFGRRSDGQLLGDVVLPKWAQSAAHFIQIHRQALESEYVSANLHKWVDLIFGAKQRGPAAVASHNVFYHLTYEGAVGDWSKVPAQEVPALQRQIECFGQTPSQLFEKEHPPRQLPDPRPVDESSAAAPVRVTSAVALPSGRKPVAVLVAPGVPSVAVTVLTTDATLCTLTIRDGITAVQPAERDDKPLPNYPWALTRGLSAGTIDAADSIFDAAADPFSAPMRATITARGLICVGGWWDGAARLAAARRPQQPIVIEPSAADEAGAATCVAAADPYLLVGTARCVVLQYMLSAQGAAGQQLQSDAPRLVMRGHASPVVAVAANAEIDVVASASGRAVLLHSLRKGRLIRAIFPPGAALVRRVLLAHHPPALAFPLLLLLCDGRAAGHASAEPSPQRSPAAGAAESRPPLDLGAALEERLSGRTSAQTLIVATLNSDEPQTYLRRVRLPHDTAVRDLCFLPRPVPTAVIACGGSREGGDADAAGGSYLRFLELFGQGVLAPVGEDAVDVPLHAIPVSVDALADGAVVAGTADGRVVTAAVERGVVAPWEVQPRSDAEQAAQEGGRIARLVGRGVQLASHAKLRFGVGD
eukprot:TRINITY_DN2369_c0_g1_i3.p1 TRINITY_DN2369_c0_g1~~TRINITY_DN2369_c0_g1_i3.p1  ORF type:complete len:2399 (+),score=770.88 TRINITY_DN2369_c0_g1_i3:113-7309(+)